MHGSYKNRAADTAALRRSLWLHVFRSRRPLAVNQIGILDITGLREVVRFLAALVPVQERKKEQTPRRGALLFFAIDLLTYGTCSTMASSG